MSEIASNDSPSKKINFFPYLLLLGCLALGYLFYLLNQTIDFPAKYEQVRSLVNTQQQADVTTELPISFEYTATEIGQTPFSLLDQDQEVEYTQYDFGVFVTSIAGQEASSQYYWAVYVNDEYAQQASDQINLQPGDKVEWRFEEIE